MISRVLRSFSSRIRLSSKSLNNLKLTQQSFSSTSESINKGKVYYPVRSKLSKALEKEYIYEKDNYQIDETAEVI